MSIIGVGTVMREREANLGRLRVCMRHRRLHTHAELVEEGREEASRALFSADPHEALAGMWLKENISSIAWVVFVLAWLPTPPWRWFRIRWLAPGSSVRFAIFGIDWLWWGFSVAFRLGPLPTVSSVDYLTEEQLRDLTKGEEPRS